MNKPLAKLTSEEILQALEARQSKRDWLGAGKTPRDAGETEAAMGRIAAPLSPAFHEQLEIARRHQDSRGLPRGTRLGPLKRLIQRLIRVFTNGQTQYNHALLQSVADLGASAQSLTDTINRLSIENAALKKEIAEMKNRGVDGS